MGVAKSLSSGPPDILDSSEQELMTRTPFLRLDALARAMLRESIPRTPPEPLEFTGPPASAALEDPGQRAVAAVGALLVWKLIQHGGCKLPVGPAVDAVNRLRDMDLAKPPGVAETLDWTESLRVVGADALDEQVVLDTIGAVVKDRDDLEVVGDMIGHVSSGT